MNNNFNLSSIPSLPIITGKYPNNDKGAIGFDTFEIGSLPTAYWQILITSEDSNRWNNFFDNLSNEKINDKIAHHDIMYYPGMNSTAPFRNYGGPLTHFRARYHGFIPLNQPLIIAGYVAEKYVKRNKTFTTFKLETYTEKGILIQEHWRTFMLPAVGVDLKGIQIKQTEVFPAVSKKISNNEFGPIRLLCSQDRLTMIEGDGELTAHTSLEKAKLMGHNKTTAQACISITKISRLLTKQFGNDFFTNGFIDIKLIKPTFSGEIMSSYGNIKKETTKEIICDLKVENTNNESVTVGIGGIKK
tara:strand:+ start:6720 stop:7625 length:906 start_codon:yes stop_codon:yes gene_type:complete